MITVRFRHPGTGNVHASELPTFCPLCVKEIEPRSDDVQRDVGEAVQVRCPTCDAIVLRWAAPLPAIASPEQPEPEPEPEP